MYEARRLRFSILMALASSGGASVFACGGDTETTGQTSTGGSGGVSTGGTGGVSTGGTAGVSTGGTAGVVSTGGTAGTAPLCATGTEVEECFTLEQLEQRINNPPQGGDVAGDAGTDAGWITLTDCADKSLVQSGCCNPASAGPEKKEGLCCYRFCEGACCGRPFTVDGHARVAAAIVRGDWQADLPEHGLGIDPVTRASLARAWLEDARMEHASVASFARFTLELLALGAPPELIADSQAASVDEVEHARLCFALASRHADELLGPGRLELPPLGEDITLERVTAAVVSEACVGETIAALVAREQRARAEDPATKCALDRIAEDEERHAALGWRFVHWALAKGGAPVRRAAERAFHEAVANARVAPAPSYEISDRAAWSRHGRLDRDELMAATRAALDEVIVPCLAELFREAPAYAESAVA
jgi:hypothetical protein